MLQRCCGEDATKQETKYESVLKTIAELKLNDETSHIQKLQLCIALARGVLNLTPGEERARVLENELEIRESEAVQKAEQILEIIEEREGQGQASTRTNAG